MKRREFIKYMGVTSGALTVIPHIFEEKEHLLAQQTKVKVFKAMNGDCFQNTNKICDMINLSNYINSTDIVVIKGNAQWPYQGYTHTGVIKAVIDKILLDNQNSIGQTFVAHYEGLQGIDLYIEPVEPGDGILSLKLTTGPMEPEEITSGSIDLSSITSPSFFHINFEPQKKSTQT